MLVFRGALCECQVCELYHHEVAVLRDRHCLSICIDCLEDNDIDSVLYI